MPVPLLGLKQMLSCGMVAKAHIHLVHHLNVQKENTSVGGGMKNGTERSLRSGLGSVTFYLARCLQGLLAISQNSILEAGLAG